MSDLHVIFGTGPTGRSIKTELLAQGQRVRMVNRSGRAALPPEVELVPGDAGDHDFAREACAGASVVYQALNPPYSKWPELFPALQASVLAGAIHAGAVYVSIENLYMYGSPGGQPMTETTPENAHTRKGAVRAQMARDLLDAHERGEVRAVIGRASDFFGPHVRVSAMGDRVFPAALAGKAAQVIGDPDQLHSYSYAPDVGRALVLLAASAEAHGQAWHIPSAETLTTRHFIERVFKATGHPPKVTTAPKLLLRVLGLFNPDVREVLEMTYQFEEPFIINGSKLERSFGFETTPLEDAIRDTVAWYRERQAGA